MSGPANKVGCTGFASGQDTAAGVVVSLPSPAAPGQRAHRGHILTRAELRAFWHQLARSGINQPLQILLRLILLTGCGKEAWAAARWEDFDLASRRWVPRRLPLGPAVLAQLQRLRSLTGPAARQLFPGLNLGIATFHSAVDKTLKKHRSEFSRPNVNAATLELTARRYIATLRRAADQPTEAVLRWGEECERLVGLPPAEVVHLGRYEDRSKWPAVERDGRR